MTHNSCNVDASDLIRMLARGKDIEYSTDNIRIILFVSL
jgi:hypothetical protein